MLLANFVKPSFKHTVQSHCLNEVSTMPTRSSQRTCCCVQMKVRERRVSAAEIVFIHNSTSKLMSIYSCERR